jgi:phenylpyruvate tautomerase PptA (4-oxalocrotonate tautomerase family)
LKKLNTSYLVNKQSTETEAELRAKIIKEISHVSEYYRGGSPKSATAILVEVMAIIGGNK